MKILNSFLSWNYSVLIQKIKLVEDVKRCTRGACFLTFYSLTFTCTCVVSTFIPMYIWSTSSESSFLYFLSPTQSKSKTAFKTFFSFFLYILLNPYVYEMLWIVKCKMGSKTFHYFFYLVLMAVKNCLLLLYTSKMN